MARKPSRPEGSFGRDPFASDEEILRATFFGTGTAAKDAAPPEAAGPEPTWRVISISLYPEDIERLDAMVAELRAGGHRRANRSALIRHALATVDLSRFPRGI